ncbi:MAG: hypothetical protein LUD25_01235 [Coriobacteriaceae bacterium]|nr:hypothetical protein [Coriobacteriaceae bacterium]
MPIIIAVVIIALFYYLSIPAINVHNMQFWWFVFWSVIIVIVCLAVPRIALSGLSFFDNIRSRGALSRRRNRENRPRRHRPALIVSVIVLAALLLGMIVGSIASSTFFNARSYSKLLQVEQGDFAEDIAEISVNTVPVVDRDSAVRLGSRTIGEISDLVSQFTIDESENAYTQISYRGTPYRVSSLQYGDIIKWFNNTRQGLPGYVTVNMVTQETELVRLPEGNYMHYSTAEHFNNYLYRYVRFRYPTTMFGDAAFEIDDNGTPYWIVPTIKMRIGLFGGEDYDGMILVNACTGEMQRFSIDSTPSWCDKIFTADMVYNQLSYFGRYQSGFWNSMIGQSGVLVPSGTNLNSIVSDDDATTTETVSSSSGWGYNYLAIGDAVWMYTGMTSANSDESLVGFVLINLQTKETKWYDCAGATENSAMSSAEGQVQQMSYVATYPLLLNIADRPTYFLSLKDDAGLVKMFAFIDVQQYQIVGTGATIDEAEANYINALGSDEEVDVDLEDREEADEAVEEQPKATGTVESIQAVVLDSNTVYYFMLKGDENVYTANIGISEHLPFIEPGDKVTVHYNQNENVREVTEFL